MKLEVGGGRGIGKKREKESKKKGQERNQERKGEERERRRRTEEWEEGIE